MGWRFRYILHKSRVFILHLCCLYFGCPIVGTYMRGFTRSIGFQQVHGGFLQGHAARIETRRGYKHPRRMYMVTLGHYRACLEVLRHIIFAGQLCVHHHPYLSFGSNWLYTCKQRYPHNRDKAWPFCARAIGETASAAQILHLRCAQGCVCVAAIRRRGHRPTPKANRVMNVLE